MSSALLKGEILDAEFDFFPSFPVVVFPEYFLTGATHESWRQVREQQSPIGSSSLVSDVEDGQRED